MDTTVEEEERRERGQRLRGRVGERLGEGQRARESERWEEVGEGVEESLTKGRVGEENEEIPSCLSLDLSLCAILTR